MLRCLFLAPVAWSHLIHKGCEARLVYEWDAHEGDLGSVSAWLVCGVCWLLCVLEGSVGLLCCVFL